MDKLEQAITMIDNILSKMKLDRQEHEAVFNTFKVIVDAARLRVKVTGPADLPGSKPTVKNNVDKKKAANKQEELKN